MDKEVISLYGIADEVFAFICFLRLVIVVEGRMDSF